MSNNQRSSNDAEGFLALFGCIFFLFWLIFGALAVYAYKGLQAPAFLKLRQLDPPAFWGAVIGSIPCTKCQVPNEMGQVICFSCGQKLGKYKYSTEIVKDTKYMPNPLAIMAGIVWLILVVAVIGLIGSILAGV